jgi:hypothetical protein
MGPCIVRIFQYTCIFNKMQRYTVLLNLKTALYVSGGNSTHHQERKQLYLQLPVFVAPLLLPAAIAVDTVVCAPNDGWRCHPKHVEKFLDTVCNVASCWIYIRIFLRCTYPWTLKYEVSLLISIAKGDWQTTYRSVWVMQCEGKM